MQYGTWRELSNSSEAKAEYLSCLKHLSALLSEHEKDMRLSTRTTLQELEDEIKIVEGELQFDKRKTGSWGN